MPQVMTADDAGLLAVVGHNCKQTRIIRGRASSRAARALPSDALLLTGFSPSDGEPIIQSAASPSAPIRSVTTGRDSVLLAARDVAMITGHDTHSGAVYRATSSARTTTATPATATPATATATPAAAMATATTATTATTAPAMTTTAAQIRTAMEALDLDQVAAHFAARADDDDDDDLDDDDVEPLVVCDGVSVRAFNEYVGDGEGLRIGVRFLQLEADGRLLIVEFPLRVHEATARRFEYAFVQAFGNVREINPGGSLTAHRAGFPRKEADATFGPFRHTPNRTPLPPNLTFEDWITLAVEIGRSQSWASLLVAARWWHGYPGIQYILLLKIGRQAKRLRYALFDALHPLVPGQGLPAPVAEGTIYRRTVGLQTPENIQFDGRRILSIPLVPQGLALPPNVNDPIVVDLRDVMTMAMLSIGRQ